MSLHYIIEKSSISVLQVNLVVFDTFLSFCKRFGLKNVALIYLTYLFSRRDSKYWCKDKRSLLIK